MPNGDHKTGEFSQLGWAKWKGEISSEISALSGDVREIFTLMRQVREDVATLKGKAAAYGAIAGTVVSIVTAIIQLWMKSNGA